MAYGVIANGGILMEPRIVKAVRARDGRVLREVAPRPIRRVVPGHVAQEIRRVLADVVETGTGRAASMGPLKVAGKTGTARVAVAGRYVPGAYDATFAGFFPATDPQLVFVVKVERPKGAYYGGATAAPVTRATLEAALAARREPLTGGVLARDAGAAGAAGLPATLDRAAEPAPVESGPFVFTLGNATVGDTRDTTDTSEAERTTSTRVVPDVMGLPLRDAVRRIHAAGLSVRVDGTGRVTGLTPAAGRVVEGDAPVRLTAKAVRR
jgi:membrane peptidoglycan carboxypeptidase